MKQVKFIDKEYDATMHGIDTGEFIVCACCGDRFEYAEVEILKRYENWVDFSEEIGDGMLDEES